MNKKVESTVIVKPLFLINNDTNHMGDRIIQFATDDYNKAIGASLLDAKNDAEAISAFLSEFRDSPLTLQSYAKEIERLLLWCIHIEIVIVSILSPIAELIPVKNFFHDLLYVCVKQSDKLVFHCVTCRHNIPKSIFEIFDTMFFPIV